LNAIVSMMDTIWVQ